VRRQQEFQENEHLSTDEYHGNREIEKKHDGGDVDVEGDMILGELEEDNEFKRSRSGKELIKGDVMELVKGSFIACFFNHC